MAEKSAKTGAELFIVDNSDADWKVLNYLHDWCQIAKSLAIATGYFEIGSLLGLKDEWQKVDHIRILMGDEVSKRTKDAFVQGLKQIEERLDNSLESEKESNDFLTGVAAIVEAIRSGKITCRVYRKDKFHAKAYITTGRLDVVGSFALVGSSNFTFPGLNENVELNVQITGGQVNALQEWYERHWNEAEDITADILRVIERQVHEYSPFEVYARAMAEFFRLYQMSDREWLENKSQVYKVLDNYQRDGFDQLMHIANRYRGAFLCDGVGLGKTFIGLMLIEYLIEKQRKRVALFVPKAARKPVWETELKKYLPHIFGEFSNLVLLSHTDLREECKERLSQVAEKADVILIDEAHHFRNPGIKGEEAEERKSRYWRMYDIAEGKTLFMLTATPVNNRLIDLQHMIELFSRRQTDYFKDAPLGIHSLPGHFRKMEKALESMVTGQSGDVDDSMLTNQAEAEKVLLDNELFRAIVVQRSRSYVKDSQKQNGGTRAIFPEREKPRVVGYSMKRYYENLLGMIEKAFDKEKPLFSLAIYYPLDFPKSAGATVDPLEKGRQIQVASLIRVSFLKRFESSWHAFETSCNALLIKLLAWMHKHAETATEKQALQRWENQHEDLIAHVRKHQQELRGEDYDADEEEDFITEEMLEDVETLSREEYRVDEIFQETLLDLDQLAEFLRESQSLDPSQDDKLRSLKDLFKAEPVLRSQKVIIFTEYMATAHYLRDQLKEEGFKSIDEVDSRDKRDRGDVIKRFAPYYNGTTSAELAAKDEVETQILISTDVLSEGLNLQDATRLINYDLHWNPVRLMQRIGRVDRRMNQQIEDKILADHPDQKEIRGKVAFWNFLPPNELDRLLRLYSRVANKTLAISKTFGIEGKQLLTPEDDYDALRDFTQKYEGTKTPMETMRLEYQQLMSKYPELAEKIKNMPQRVFSGKAHPSPDAKAVFFCYSLPAPPVAEEGKSEEQATWLPDEGGTKWYLYDIATEKISDEPTEIVSFIRCVPETPRQHIMEEKTLSEIRRTVEKHIKNTYLKQVQAPVGVKASLKAWMELS